MFVTESHCGYWLGQCQIGVDATLDEVNGVSWHPLLTFALRTKGQINQNKGGQRTDKSQWIDPLRGLKAWTHYNMPCGSTRRNSNKH